VILHNAKKSAFSLIYYIVSQCRLHPRWSISSGNWYQRWRICHWKMELAFTAWDRRLLVLARKAKKVS